MENKKYYLEVIEKDENDKIISRYNLIKINNERKDYFKIDKNINCLIGTNNSGKSRVLRQILNPIKFNNEIESKDFKSLSKYREFIKNLIDNYRLLGINVDTATLPDDNSLLSLKIVSKIYTDFKQNFNAFKTLITNHNLDNRILSNLKLNINLENREIQPGEGVSLENIDINNIVKNYIINIDNVFEIWIKIESYNTADLCNQKIYIPTLRGLRPLNAEKENLYEKRTIADYNLHNVDVFTGWDLYDRIQNMLLGYKKDRDNVGAFESFLSKNFFDGHDISLTTPKDKDVVHIKIGEEKEHEIYHVGDGIQQLIILLFPFFENRGKRDITICIEEPELFLHPKWQKIFIDTISQKEFENIHVFFTTHSNAFINHEAVDIYEIKKEEIQENDNIKTDLYLEKYNKEDYKIANICGPILVGKKELLAELGYQASDVLASNYIIWVEGISDKYYIEKFIELYDKNLIAGIHYTILQYNGCDNLEQHYTFNPKESDKICIQETNKHCAIMIDSDALSFKDFKGKCNPAQQTRYKFIEASKKENILYWITSCRETENLIPIDIWKKAAINLAHEIKKITAIDYSTTIDGLDENNVAYGDRCKMKILGSNIKDKTKLAKAICKIISKEDLEASPELALYIPQLCKAIAEANGDKESYKHIDSSFLAEKETALNLWIQEQITSSQMQAPQSQTE